MLSRLDRAFALMWEFHGKLKLCMYLKTQQLGVLPFMDTYQLTWDEWYPTNHGMSINFLHFSLFGVRMTCFKRCHRFSTPPKMNIALENRPFQQETIVFQVTIFRCELLVAGGVGTWGVHHVNYLKHQLANRQGRSSHKPQCFLDDASLQSIDISPDKSLMVAGLQTEKMANVWAAESEISFWKKNGGVDGRSLITTCIWNALFRCKFTWNLLNFGVFLTPGSWSLCRHFVFRLVSFRVFWARSWIPLIHQRFGDTQQPRCQLCRTLFGSSESWRRSESQNHIFRSWM